MLAAALAAALAVEALPLLARHVPWSVERWLARALPQPEVEAPCRGTRDPRALELWNRLVARLYPLDAQDRGLPIRIDPIPGPTVNAFATLGGHIYVFQGLIEQAQSADELAGVLAHEIEHVRNRHVLQAMAVDLLTVLAVESAVPGGGSAAAARLAYFFVTLKFSRRQEAEADALGLQRLRAAHVGSSGFAQFFERASKMPAPPEILDNHPASESRAQLAAQSRGYPIEPIMSASDWRALQTICP